MVWAATAFGSIAEFFAFFALGAVGFWLILTAATAGILWSISAISAYQIEYYGSMTRTSKIGGGAFATFAFAMFVTLTVLGNMREMPSYLHWFWTPFAAILCIGGGVGTALWKWTAFNLDITDRYNELNEKFHREHGFMLGDTIPADLEKEWERKVGPYKNKPNFYASVKLITAWAIYWPWVLAWSALHDLVKRMFRMAIEACRGVFTRISDAIWDKRVVLPQFAAPASPEETSARASVMGSHDRSTASQGRSGIAKLG